MHALLCWELGANRGHVVALGAIARELLARGDRVTFAVQRLDALRALRPLAPEVAVLQAPVWPGLLSTGGQRTRVQTASFGDILAGLGLRDSGVVEFLLRGWDGLLAAVKPDVVVANFAPMAQLAARGRVPVLAAGNGFSLPPCELDSFPRLIDSERSYGEEHLLQAVNLGLARSGRPALGRLPQLVAADVRAPHVLGIFDPYRASRNETRRPPILPAWTQARAGSGDEVFAYFSDTMSRPERLYDALARLARPVRLHIPNLAPDVAARLAGGGVIVEPRPLAIASIAEKSRLVVSHGGLGFVSMTLAAGLPQLILAPDLEKSLIGRAVQALGVGRLLDWRAAQAERIAAAAEDLAADEATRRRASALADDLAPELVAGSAAWFADEAVRLGTL